MSEEDKTKESWLLTHMRDTGRIDDTDYKILEALMEDSRQSTQSVSDAAGVSRATAHERIRKLIERGFIRKFVPKFNYSKAGLPLKAYILVGYDAPNAKDQHGNVFPQNIVAKQISDIPFVNSVSIITGQYDFLVQINIDHMNNLADIIIEAMRNIPGVSGTVTLLQFDEFVNGHREPRPDIDD